jgi:hypothetical protein
MDVCPRFFWICVGSNLATELISRTRSPTECVYKIQGSRLILMGNRPQDPIRKVQENWHSQYSYCWTRRKAIRLHHSTVSHNEARQHSLRRPCALLLLLLLLLLWLCLVLDAFPVSWSYTQPVGLLGRRISPSQGLYLHNEQHEHRINAYNTDIHALSGTAGLFEKRIGPLPLPKRTQHKKTQDIFTEMPQNHDINVGAVNTRFVWCIYVDVKLDRLTRFYTVLTVVYNKQDYWGFGLCPSSGVLRNTEERNVSETGCDLDCYKTVVTLTWAVQW